MSNLKVSIEFINGNLKMCYEVGKVCKMVDCEVMLGVAKLFGIYGSEGVLRGLG